MNQIRKLAGRGTAITAFAAAAALSIGGLAYADNIQDTIAATGTVTLVAGSGISGEAAIRVVGNNAAGDPDPGCNIDAGENPLRLDIVTPAGVTANPDPLSITSCGTDFPVSFTASSAAVSGHATVTILSTPAGGGTYMNQVDIPITVKQPPPVNTKPSVEVEGVTNGAEYEIGAVPAATCAITDTEDGNSSKAAVLSGDLNHGLGLRTATCDYTDHGELAADTKSVTYTIADTGNPTISHTLIPVDPDGDNGWYKSDVEVKFTCADEGGSGIKSCVGDATLGNGTDQSAQGTATDWAGNTATDTVSGIDVDTSAPNAPTASLSPSPNGKGWNNTDVVVSFTEAGDEGPSGIAACSADVPVTAETDGQAVTGICTDKAGNQSPATEVTVKVDKTGPSISNTVTVSGTEGTNGWYKSDVVITFTATDTLSGPATAEKTVTSSGEGAAVVVNSPQFSDDADNTTDAGAVTRSYKIDKTKPTVGFTGGPSASYYFGSNPAAPTCDASDATSAVASCVISGGGVSVGAHSYTATATDKAGNVATATLNYEVLAWTLKGFYQPVDVNGVWNTVKGGSTVPLKFEVFSGSTELTTTSSVKSFTQKTVSCLTSAQIDEIELVTTGGTSLRYDSTAGQFIQNWQTPKKPGTCYTTTMTTQDDTSITANFMLK